MSLAGGWPNPLTSGSMRFAGMILCAAVLSGCATIRNEPINVPLAAADAVPVDATRGPPTSGDDLLIGLAFSGGGTRAAAFSYGVLSELDRNKAEATGQKVSLLDRVDYISGVSGGAVTAAYFGLKGRDGLSDFRERFLLRDAEESLRSPFAPVSVLRAYEGGVNDAQQFPRWLDDNLFRGATFRELNSAHRPRVLINASDVYNRTPFVFNDATFKAICSDLNSYPIASAVAASAAIPVVFAPIVLTSYGGRCQATLPHWITAAKINAAAPPLLKELASAIARYRDGSVPYIKLLDGGLVDNYGLSGFTIARLSAETPYGPPCDDRASMHATAAVRRARRLLPNGCLRALPSTQLGGLCISRPRDRAQPRPGRKARSRNTTTLVPAWVHAGVVATATYLGNTGQDPAVSSESTGEVTLYCI